MSQFPSEPHITYHLRYWQCEDPSCQLCCLGPGHGPDWYASWFKDGELYSLYIGPADLTSLASLLASSSAENPREPSSGSPGKQPGHEEGFRPEE